MKFKNQIVPIFMVQLRMGQQFWQAKQVPKKFFVVESIVSKELNDAAVREVI